MAIKLDLSGDIHIHFHDHESSHDKGAIAAILQKLDYVIKQNNLIMATSQERYDAINARLDTITNDIAADYKKLLEEAKNNSVSPESLAAGEANVAKLEALGASVDNPVPEGL